MIFFQSKDYRDNLYAMEDLIADAINDTVKPDSDPITMQTENITMTVTQSKLESILGE